MKHLAIFLVTLLGALSPAFAAQMLPAHGRVVDTEGNAIQFATVVLLKDAEQVAGMTTDEEGRFELKVPAGEYTLSVQFLGFEGVEQAIKVETDNDLGDITLKASSTAIEGVAITAQLVRREADRFVVDVTNAPSAIGKDGVELLETAPGVWIDGETISVNGKTGSKVYVNERELRMESAQLLTYLRSLKASDIRQIEVVPTTGADYDADSSGGVIRITLKKQREDGLEGSAEVSARVGKWIRRLSPNANINYHSDKWDLYGRTWFQKETENMNTTENTIYAGSNTNLRASSEHVERGTSFRGNLGAVYQMNPRHSLGLEFDYWHARFGGPNDSNTDLTAESEVTNSVSRYDSFSIHNNYALMFNYIWRIDSLGSTFKVLADHTRRDNDADNDNFTRFTTPLPGRDSTYRDNSTARYDITTTTLALDKRFSPKWSLRTGVKYTYNDMNNTARYQYKQAEAWVENTNQSFAVDYTENIAAAYGVVSANLGRWSLVAGLRGEYTSAKGRANDVSQEYFSLFPNANVSYALTKDGAYSLIAQYARTIRRPGFWALNPQRFQVSDYTYQIGNPGLDPAYTHDVSLTLVLKHKYTLTGGMRRTIGEIQQTILTDPDDPNMMYLTHMNFDKTDMYYLAVNAPIQVRKWWSMNFNANFVRMGQRIDIDSPREHFNYLYTGLSNTFTLPAEFYIDLSYRFQSRAQIGTITVEPMQFVNLGLKKRFGDRFTVSLLGANLLGETQKISSRGDGSVRNLNIKQAWNSRYFQVGLTYNFKSGKAFRRKAVESGSAEEKGRLQQK